MRRRSRGDRKSTRLHSFPPRRSSDRACGDRGHARGGTVERPRGPLLRQGMGRVVDRLCGGAVEEIGRAHVYTLSLHDALPIELAVIGVTLGVGLLSGLAALYFGKAWGGSWTDYAAAK